jgi:hypothetical protein
MEAVGTECHRLCQDMIMWRPDCGWGQMNKGTQKMSAKPNSQHREAFCIWETEF